MRDFVPFPALPVVVRIVPIVERLEGFFVTWGLGEYGTYPQLAVTKYQHWGIFWRDAFTALNPLRPLRFDRCARFCGRLDNYSLSGVKPRANGNPVAQAIISRAGGNPFFLEELLDGAVYAARLRMWWLAHLLLALAAWRLLLRDDLDRGKRSGIEQRRAEQIAARAVTGRIGHFRGEVGARQCAQRRLVAQQPGQEIAAATARR